MLVSARPVADVRGELGRLSPSPLVQYLITRFTGKPLPGEQPLLRHTPWSVLGCAVVSLLAGTAASAFLWRAGGASRLLLPVSLLWTGGASRVLMITVLHHLVHGNFSASKRVDRVVFELIAVPLFLVDFDTYHQRHVAGHHGPRVASRDDPEAYGMGLGFLPGTPQHVLWRKLWLTLLSPAFHLRLLRERVLDCFVRTTPGRAARAGLFHYVLMLAVARGHAWDVLLVAWLLPITVLFNIGALLQFSSEHRWYLAAEGRGRARLASLTFGRFVGEMPPGADAGYLAWVRFWLRMLLIHAPSRMLVLVADMPQHDSHHRHPTCFDWANAEYARQADRDAGCPGWPEYTEVWGLGAALHEAFGAVAAAG